MARWRKSLLSTALRLAPRHALLGLPSHDSTIFVDRHLDRHLAIAGLAAAGFWRLRGRWRGWRHQLRRRQRQIGQRLRRWQRRRQARQTSRDGRGIEPLRQAPGGAVERIGSSALHAGIEAAGKEQKAKSRVDATLHAARIQRALDQLIARRNCVPVVTPAIQATAASVNGSMR
jgi:hypothetical protein